MSFASAQDEAFFPLVIVLFPSRKWFSVQRWKSLHTSRVAHQASAYVGFSAAWSDQEYFYPSPDGMLVHHRISRSIKFSDTNLYIWAERGTERVKFTAEAETMST